MAAVSEGLVPAADKHTASSHEHQVNLPDQLAERGWVRVDMIGRGHKGESLVDRTIGS